MKNDDLYITEGPKAIISDGLTIYFNSEYEIYKIWLKLLELKSKYEEKWDFVHDRISLIKHEMKILGKVPANIYEELRQLEEQLAGVEEIINAFEKRIERHEKWLKERNGEQ